MASVVKYVPSLGRTRASLGTPQEALHQQLTTHTHGKKHGVNNNATMNDSTRGQEDGNTFQQLLRDIRAQGDAEREALEFLSHKLHKKLHEQKLKRMSLDYLREYVARQERDLAALRGGCVYGCEVLRK